MKKIIVRFANRFLGMLGARLISTDVTTFTMECALERMMQKHKFSIKSVIDIGASNGIWSIKAMNYLPDSHFLAIEPLTERESALKKIQTCNDKFRYAMCVAGERNEKVSLSVSKDLDGSTVVNKGKNIRIVPAKTLDSLVMEYGLKPPYLLKFDTHGYELPILRGAEETLAKTNVIIMEVYNFHITENSLRFPGMCTYLESVGFMPFDQADPMLRKFDSSLWQMDFFFCRSDSKIFTYNQFS